MKLTVRVREDWLTVPCKGGELVRWLGEEAIRRYMRARPAFKAPAAVSAAANGPAPNGGDGAATNGGGSREAANSSGAEPVTVNNGGVPDGGVGCELLRLVLVKRASGGSILDFDDPIESVLDDNDFVIVVLEEEVAKEHNVSAKISYLNDHVEGVAHEPTEVIYVDGDTLSCEDLMRLGTGHFTIKLTPESIRRVNKARLIVDNIVAQHKVAYGINTGFGKFARTIIASEDLCQLQKNLIRSHAAGVGEPLSPHRTRRLLALRINVLAKGYSGISLNTLQQYIDAFNASCLSWVPEKGTVGASGDLAPLAHLALGIMGEGKMSSPKTGWAEAKEVLAHYGLKPIRLEPKEGLALINGTQLITALGVEGLERAHAIAKQGDIVAALTIEVLKGTTKAFDADIHAMRPHKGQISVASRFRSLLQSDVFPSEISESHRFCNRVQDAYTLRCIPQVHGIVHDTIDFVRGILSVEMNSATDNPMVFADRGEIISGGNFHGEYPAKALDYLAIGINELATMSERRIERLINPAYSELPAFLTNNGGLNSGFMIAQCTAAALVSENKVLCHPASADSITTSAGTEDHVSMGGFAARKLLQIVSNVETVVAIELLAACQAIEFLRPMTTTSPLEEVHRTVRSTVTEWDQDRFMAPDIEAAIKLLREGKIWEVVVPYFNVYSSAQLGMTAETPVPSPTASSCKSPLPHSKPRAHKRKLSAL